MLLAINIGNTNIHLGLFKGERLRKHYTLGLKKGSSHKLLWAIFKKNKIRDTLICSVVPRQTASLARQIKAISRRRPLIIGKDIIVPIKNLYRNPKQAGSDRLVNAYAAVRLYGAPLIALDFGTAITFDVISRKKEYLGGLILPGLQLCLDALSERTALLPEVKLARPRELIGRDTKNAMLSGVVYGFAAVVDNLLESIRKKIGKEAEVIATGGNAAFIRGYCRNIFRVNQDLTLIGLKLLYKNWQNDPV